MEQVHYAELMSLCPPFHAYMFTAEKYRSVLFIPSVPPLQTYDSLEIVDDTY